jgi:hypothetical protein
VVSCMVHNQLGGSHSAPQPQQGSKQQGSSNTSSRRLVPGVALLSFPHLMSLSESRQCHHPLQHLQALHPQAC